MNLNPVGGYQSHQAVHAAESAASERHLSHRRAREEAKLESRQAVDGFVARFLARWRQQAKIEMEPVVRSAQQLITESRCVLSDGTPGRIALRQVEDSWVEVCVPT